MGKMKDEWFEEFYGDYPNISQPRWHTDDPIGEPHGGDKITFRPWSEASLADIADGWLGDDSDFDSTTEELKGSALAFNVYDIQDELFDLLLRKHEDYGPKNISASPGGPLNGLNVRLYDKVARLENLMANGKTPKNESVRDTFLDIANYAIIGLLVIDGKWSE
jgi:hypothetical protein